MEQIVKRAILDILKRVVEEFKRDQFLVSRTISIINVGSLAFPNFKPSLINELDLIFVVDDERKEIFERFSDLLERVCAYNKHLPVNIFYTWEHGFRDVSVSEPTIIIDADICTKDDKDDLVLHWYSWQFYEPLYGISLREIACISSITSYDVINTKGGIKKYLDLLKQREDIIIKKRILDNKLVKRQAYFLKIESDKHLLYTCCKAVLDTVANAVRIYEPILNKEENIRKFKQYFSHLCINEMPEKALIFQNNLKNGILLEKEKIEDFCQETISFLENLMSYLLEGEKTKCYMKNNERMK